MRPIGADAETASPSAISRTWSQVQWSASTGPGSNGWNSFLPSLGRAHCLASVMIRRVRATRDSDGFPVRVPVEWTFRRVLDCRFSEAHLHVKKALHREPRRNCLSNHTDAAARSTSPTGSRSIIHEDRHETHVSMADVAVRELEADIPDRRQPGRARSLPVARHTGADAISSGLRFLSENDGFARQRGEFRIMFIRPSAAAPSGLWGQDSGRASSLWSRVPSRHSRRPGPQPRTSRTPPARVGFRAYQAASVGATKDAYSARAFFVLTRRHVPGGGERHSVLGDGRRVYRERYIEAAPPQERRSSGMARECRHLLRRVNAPSSRYQKIIEASRRTKLA